MAKKAAAPPSPLCFLQADKSVSEDEKDEIYEHIVSVRMNQRYPIFYMELEKDQQMIGQMFADEPQCRKQKNKTSDKTMLERLV